MLHHIPGTPSVDKFMAVFGNGASLTAWLLTPSTLTAIGGVMVSCSTAAYFVMRALHERQRMRHEQELHDRKLAAQAVQECPECGAENEAEVVTCESCGGELS